MTNQGGAKKDINKLHAVMGKIDDLMQVFFFFFFFFFFLFIYLFYFDL